MYFPLPCRTKRPLPRRAAFRIESSPDAACCRVIGYGADAHPLNAQKLSGFDTVGVDFSIFLFRLVPASYFEQAPAQVGDWCHLWLYLRTERR